LAFGDRLKANFAESLDPKAEDYLNRMQSASRRMQTLINDLLTLSRVTTRGQPFIEVDLNQIAQDVISDLEVQIQETGGEVVVSELPCIEADPAQMRQLLQNLVSNALKFHHVDRHPRVRISAEMFVDDEPDPNLEQGGQECCRIRIEDNGIGFKIEYLDRIFQPFQRLQGREEYEGTGMGLAIARRIIERHDGEITAVSEPGQGATFIVTLPIIQEERRRIT
jgi:signal transduction histidine kinase